MQALHKIVQYLFYANISPEEYKEILPNIHEHNRGKLIAFSSIGSIFFFIMAVISVFMEGYNPVRCAYVWSLGAFLVILAATYFQAEKNPIVLKAGIYAFEAILFLFGIYSSNYVYSHNSATAYIAFVLTVPVLFVARPMKKIGIILFFNLLFAITAAGQKSAEIFPVDIINAMVFGGISIIAAAYIMGIYFDYFVTKRQLAVMAEMDALTGLRN